MASAYYQLHPELIHHILVDEVDEKRERRTIYIPPAQRILPLLPHSELLLQTTNPSHPDLIISNRPVLILPCCPLFRVSRVVSKYVVGLASIISVPFPYSLSPLAFPARFPCSLFPARWSSRSLSLAIDSHNIPLEHLLLLVHPPPT